VPPNEPANPYEPPKADVEIAPQAAQGASLEGAMAGRYDFTIGEVMDEAWKLSKGFKASFWGAAVVIGVVLVVVQGIVRSFLGQHPNALAAAFVNGVVGALLSPLTMGLTMMCVRRALGQPVSFSTAFSYLPKASVAITAGLLVTVLSWIGFVLLVIPGIYLSVAFGLKTPLIGDQNLRAWQAMETSRKAITHKWWRVFGLYLVVGLLTALSALGLLIPLIWTGPWAMLTIGVLYRRIFYAPIPAARLNVRA